MDAPLEIDVATAARMLPAGALLLDVREDDEVAICRIEGSRHIPMERIPESLGTLPRDRPVLVLCHHGSRSRQVTRYLRANGFGQASNIAGGIDAWAAQHDPAMPRY